MHQGLAPLFYQPAFVYSNNYIKKKITKIFSINKISQFTSLFKFNTVAFIWEILGYG